MSKLCACDEPREPGSVHCKACGDRLREALEQIEAQLREATAKRDRFVAALNHY